MSFDRHEKRVDYAPCRYGVSDQVFRGPAAPLDKPYVAVVGGSETYGRFVVDPFSARLAGLTGHRVANFGVQNASVDAFVSDAGLGHLIRAAETLVVQVMPAGNVSNRFYSVHPRRNDRFLRHSPLMETLFPDVEFGDFAFTGHMLQTLRNRSKEKYRIVMQELEEAWVARMRLLLSRAPDRKILLWIENGLAEKDGPEPLLVTEAMIERLGPLAGTLVRVDIAQYLGPNRLLRMVCEPLDQGAALRSLPDEAHMRIAEELSRVLGREGMAR